MANKSHRALYSVMEIVFVLAGALNNNYYYLKTVGTGKVLKNYA